MTLADWRWSRKWNPRPPEEAAIAELLSTAKGRSRPHKLLNIINSGASLLARRLALSFYCGYRQGIKLFKKLIHEDNEILFKTYPPDQQRDIFYWGATNHVLLHSLLFTLSQMGTTESNELLRQYANPEYHPVVRGEAI